MYNKHYIHNTGSLKNIDNVKSRHFTNFKNNCDKHYDKHGFMNDNSWVSETQEISYKNIRNTV